MATLKFSYSDLMELLGEEIPISEVVESLTMMGVPVEEVKGDEIEVEVFPNRPDLLSVEGIARALKGFLGIETGLSSFRVTSGEIKVFVSDSVKKIRPYISCGVIKGVDLGREETIVSLMQMQEKLHETIGRRRRKASIGIYDLDKISPPIYYKVVGPEEVRFVPLDSFEEMCPREIIESHPKGIEYGWILSDLDKYPLLVDSNGTVLSMPPIINSEETKVEENTKNLFVDVTGTHEETVSQVLNIVLTSISERGGVIESVIVRDWRGERTSPDLSPLKINLRKSYVEKLLGIELKVSEIKSLLEKMRLGVSDDLSVLVPAYRVDVLHEIDLVEEIAIAYNYMKFEAKLPEKMTLGEEDRIESFLDLVRDVLIGLGYQEVMTFSLTNEEIVFNKCMAPKVKYIEIMNPKTEKYRIIRPWIYPGLIKVLSNNKSSTFPQTIFEVGEVAYPDEAEETGARIEIHLCAAVTHPKAGYTEIRSVLDVLMREFGVELQVRPRDFAAFIPGRSGEIIHKERQVGFIGEVHPEVLVLMGLENPVALFELNLSEIFEGSL